MATFFAALAFIQSMRVVQTRKHANVVVAVPVRQRFWKWRVHWLTIRAFGRVPEITNTYKGISARRAGVVMVEENGRVLDFKVLYL